MDGQKMTTAGTIADMHVLFIGGTGLISTAIARQMLERGDKVTLFNRGQSENRLPEGADVIHGDRKDYAAFEAAFAGQSYDVVVDMVAFHPDDSASAVRAFEGRCGQFVHCSTVCVYSGPVTQIPTTETEPYHSIGGYGQNKIACEQLLLDAFGAQSFPVTIMRPSHSYGEGGGVIRSFGPNGTFVDRLRKGRPLIVPGDGNGLWASCHVDDVARGFLGVFGNDKCLGEAYNITGDEWMTWNQYHQQVAEVVGGTFGPVHIPTDTLREIAPEYAGSTYEILQWPSVFDNAKIKRDTDYPGQTVSFREGVRRTVAWLESQGKIAASTGNDYEDRLIAAWQAQTGQLPRPE
jgi:nucleoside-diphosphate-sugar epimerase